MARLFRLSTLNDRFDTRVFTFQLPASVSKENTPDACSRDFTYGYQSWGVSAVRYERHVGVYLTLRSACVGLTVIVDYGFTLVNGEHFTKNEVFTERGCVFTSESATHGRSTFVGVPDLTSRGFRQDSGEFVLELELGITKDLSNERDTRASLAIVL
ncbi:hypothetical protein LSH36_1042g01011 [Paralvinella palmiformis]|uniref:MATH domain-containing protein n=1 Tax=Paralvinella palmiformis TaxID=53620 RepID=A0AAD9IWW7_9ANNE|nr:hypothetical protein LSH36_1042g01011 [Paralvinella palmiformis]